MQEKGGTGCFEETGGGQKGIKDLEEKLLQLSLNEERFRYALANSPGVLAYHDSELRYTWVFNSKMLGIPLEEIIGKTDRDLFPEDYMPLIKIKQNVMRTETAARDEVKVTVNGEEFYCDLYVYPTFDRLGNVVGVSCVFYDITRLKRTEQALLRIQKEKYDILESIADAFFSLDREFRFTYVNMPARRAMNMSNKVLIGRKISEVYSEIPDDYLEVFKQVMEDRKPQHRELLCTVLKRWVEASVFPCHNGVSVYFRDIHKRKKAEESLRRSEERFHLIFHANPTIMAISRAKDAVFVDVNQAWENCIEYSRMEVIGRTSMDLNIFVDPDDWLNMYESLRQSNRILNKNVQVRSKSGRILDLILSADVIELHGDLCFLSTAIDVTESKRLEKEMARLERLNLIGELAASIGHEIRNPLTAIRGFLQMLNNMECYDRDKIYFSLMIEELDRANTIISEYLGMARDENLDFEARSIDLVVQSIFPMLQADAYYRGMNIELDLNNPPPVLIDENEIRQLILNIARNGIEAMQPGGKLTIGTMRDAAGNAVIYIRDQGPGVDPAVFNKLGTPFLTTKQKGTGLGLAVCYNIAARHNAKIEADTSSKGTVFKILLPAAAEQLTLF